MGVVFFVCVLVCVAEGWMSNENVLKMTLDSIKCTHDKNLQINVTKTKVYFYDFSMNITKEFEIDDAAKGILSLPKLNTTKKLNVYVAGFKSPITGSNAAKIIKAYKNHTDSYLIILDHYTYTSISESGIITNYQRSVKHVYYIGKALALMLAKLREGGIPSRNIHCIGHSLGSQMLGNTGEIYHEITGEKIHRITALDPARPCFSDERIDVQIRSGVAEYVDIYHCNAGLFGTTSILGDADFFANSLGKYQPGCDSADWFGLLGGPAVAQCNHNYCIDIWARTVNNKNLYLAWRDPDLAQSDRSQKGFITYQEQTIAGLWTTGKANGVYYFTTE